MPHAHLEFVTVGGLREDYFITSANEAHLREIGGNALYAAVGARLWAEQVGLCARVGENYPKDWLDKIETQGIDTVGVKVVPGHQDTRTFYAYLSPDERVDIDPAAHFARIGQPLPAELANYLTSTEGQADRNGFPPLAVRPSEIPAHYYNATGFHLSPAEFLVHHTLPVQLRGRNVRHITCDPSVRYMTPEFAEEVKGLVKGLSAFLPSEMEVRAFFGNGVKDLWEAAEAFGAMGTKCVVIKLGARGQYVYDVEAKRKWHVPAYTVRMRDVTGAGDAYCGGFLVGLARTHDPLEAALYGSISASLVIEGPGAFYALASSPALAEARRQSLRAAVRTI